MVQSLVRCSPHEHESCSDPGIQGFVCMFCFVFLFLKPCPSNLGTGEAEMGQGHTKGSLAGQCSRISEQKVQ